MTAHSEHEGVILFPSESLQDRFVDAAKVRDWYLNNLLHLYDEYFQLRVAWSVTTDQDGDRPAAYGSGFQLVSRDPFPITLRADGSPPPLIVRFSTKRNHSSSGVDAGWRIIAHGFRGVAIPPLDTSSDRVADSAHNTDDSKEHGPFTLQMNADQVTAETRTSDASKGGDVEGVTVVWAEVSVWISSDADVEDTTPSELRSLNVREFVGHD